MAETETKKRGTKWLTDNAKQSEMFARKLRELDALLSEPGLPYRILRAAYDDRFALRQSLLTKVRSITAKVDLGQPESKKDAEVMEAFQQAIVESTELVLAIGREASFEVEQEKKRIEGGTSKALKKKNKR